MMAEPNPLLDLVRMLSGRQDARLRYLTPEQARRQNVPNALVDAVPVPGTMGKRLRPSRYMLMPQSTYQALESLTRDTGVTWPEETRARALLTLVHEAGHLRGGKNWQDERRQHEFALRQLPRAMRTLGLGPEQRKAFWKYAIDYTRSLPKNYQTPGLIEELLRRRPIG